jgi:hypothetical protein
VSCRLPGLSGEYMNRYLTMIDKMMLYDVETGDEGCWECSGATLSRVADSASEIFTSDDLA